MSEQTDTIEAVACSMCIAGGFDPDEMMPNDGPRWRYYVPGAQAAIAAHTKALVEGAGEYTELLELLAFHAERQGGDNLYDDAQVAIVTLIASVRHVQAQLATARIESVRAGIEASAGVLDTAATDMQADGMAGTNRGAIQNAEDYAATIRALDPAAIVKGETQRTLMELARRVLCS